MTTSPAKPKPISAECTAAEQLDWPEQHARCAGNKTLRLSTVPSSWPPVQKYRCDCKCHSTAAGG